MDGELSLIQLIKEFGLQTGISLFLMKALYYRIKKREKELINENKKLRSEWKQSLEKSEFLAEKLLTQVKEERRKTEALYERIIESNK